jgi:formate hydrogenlyase subunit 6/NADH:ubiquinone oxidoreductase subunit I
LRFTASETSEVRAFVAALRGAIVAGRMRSGRWAAHWARGFEDVETAIQTERMVTLDRGDLDRLIETLRERGYEVIGPVAREGAIVYDTITRAAELPVGWTDTQEAGIYRISRDGGEAMFDYNLGPSSWKRFLHPPRMRLWRAERGADGLQIVEGPEPAPRYAFLGVRACELHAIAIQDRVFLGGPFVDPIYRARREAALIIVVQCGRAGHTCFCASMGTGPHAKSGFDLALTEVIEGGRHTFVVEPGSPRGIELLGALPHRPAGETETNAVAAAASRAKEQMGRKLDTRGLPELMSHSHENPRWEDVAKRCLTCANCTQVCPTCFCTSVEDHLGLGGASAERVRRWDSCFTLDFSYVHGGSVRPSARARYRQWLTHKLGSWHQQFGSSGCVGCGRCITWCPAGIDLTEEVPALRKGAARKDRHGGDA